MEYAVRGPLVIRASEIEKELQTKSQKPFKEVIKSNIGDAHAMGQIPITFVRQVLALTVYPKLLNDDSFPQDAKQHACDILDGCKGQSVGSYSDSAGIEIIRRHVAEFIAKRDGLSSDYGNIILANGASEAIKWILRLFIKLVDGKPSGVMVPIPQYPLYSATISEFGLAQIGYYLNGEERWALDLCELERSFEDSKKTCCPRVIVTINPGNPTGQVLTRQNIEDVIRFAHKHQLFIMADEVYQENIYDQNFKFHSFKKVMMEMGEPYSCMELASFHSASKGYLGECGIRGGYCEVINLDGDVMAILQKSITASLCSSVCGQVVVDTLVKPPDSNGPSYELYNKEKKQVLQSLEEKSRMIVDMINSIEGLHATPSMGAMYVFPRIEMPQKALEAAEKAKQHPDVFYCFRLLEATGICVVPGSGFGQKEGTYHFRTTILPPKELVKTMLERFKEFHENFLKEFK